MFLIRSAIIAQIKNLVIDEKGMSSLEFLNRYELSLVIGNDEINLEFLFFN